MNQDTGIAECSLSLVEGLEVFAGMSSRWKTGAVTGALAGGLAMAVLGGVSFDCQEKGTCVRAASNWFPFGTVPGGVIGAIIGGAAFQTEKWEEVPLHPPSFLVRPSSSGPIAFGLTFRVPDW